MFVVHMSFAAYDLSIMSYSEMSPASETSGADQVVMRLYHCTTQKKAKNYRQSGRIIAPVRGFTTLQGAMAWAIKVGRTVILEIDCNKPHKLPDHHNNYGEAWWNDGDVTEWRCVFSADKDA